jgi:hypothetical protein
VHPKTGAKFLASKEKKQPGTVYALPETLSTSGPNVATDLGKPVPEDISDGTFTIDGSQVLLRTRDAVHVVDPASWRENGTLPVPEVKQGESIAMEPGGTSFIIGSEGKNSPLFRVAYGPDAPNLTPSAAPDERPSSASEPHDDGGVRPGWLLASAGLAVLAAAAAVAWRVSRRS